ncbi:MAG: preprotein translocase subunit SecD [Euryarchaeota archaeon]|nr:preprotein translocase subunit SecD [Euryarchaeota archaeon]
MEERGLLGDIRIIALILLVIAALVAIYVYPTPPADAGIDGNLKYGLDLVGGSWLQLKLEGTLVGINASVNESTVATYLEKELDTEVNYYKSDRETVYEIRKSVSKTKLSELLTGVNGSITKKPDGKDYFEESVIPETRDETKRIIETKLNILGLADIKPRTVGNNFILIDLAGVDIGTAKRIVGNPGKFEIRIQTEGVGGDIKKGQRLDEIANISAHVIYGSEGIESRSVGTMPEREKEDRPWGATFTLKEKGAVALRDAAIEYNATVDRENHELTMLLDEVVVYSASLSPDLAIKMKDKPERRLRAETGLGDEGLKEAKELIIHLKAGVLPVNVNIIGSGEIPAYLGAQFKEGAAIAGLFALIFVTVVVFLRYREKKIVLPMFFALLSEVILILGFAAAIGWQMDLPSIAGIIAVIGTGVDQLVIITDEVLSGGRSSKTMYRKRISFAFGIIFVSAATTIVAMLALGLMALGTLKGFAIVTIVGLLIGIFITRPAYARIIEDIL